MEIMFSKNTFIIMGITYVILLIAFVIGYNLPQKSFIAIPALGGVIATVIVLPFVTIAGSLFIVYALKSKNTLIGYLILAIGSYILVYGAVFAVEKMSDLVRIRGRSEERQKQNDYMNNTIAQVKMENKMFELIQVAENTYYIDCPAKIGIYRLQDDTVILIDSGNDRDAGRKILKIANERNWKVNAIINTHSNADHIGGNKFIADRTGCKIYANGIEKVFCEHPILEPAFLFGGYPNRHLRHKFLLAEPSHVCDVKEFVLPENMELFPLKGHFFDMVGVKTPDNVYFLADSVFSESLLNKYPVSFIYDVAEYFSTLDFIETLNGKLFIPAHADPAVDIKPLVELNRQKTEEVMGCIKKICENPSSFETILGEIFDKYGMVMDVPQYALVGSTIKSYLSYMLDHNILDMEIKDNNWLWKAITG